MSMILKSDEAKDLTRLKSSPLEKNNRTIGEDFSLALPLNVWYVTMDKSLLFSGHQFLPLL